MADAGHESKVRRWLETAILAGTVFVALGTIGVKQLGLATASELDRRLAAQKASQDTVNWAIMERLDCLLLDRPPGCAKQIRPFPYHVHR